MSKILITMFCLLLVSLVPMQAMPETDLTADEFAELVSQLHVKSYKEKEAIIKKIAEIKDPRKVPILQRMQDGELFYRNSDKKIVFREASAEQYRITDVLNNQDLGLVDAGSIKKVKINNKLRRVIRGIIARLSLQDEDAGQGRRSKGVRAVTQAAQDRPFRSVSAPLHFHPRGGETGSGSERRDGDDTQGERAGQDKAHRLFCTYDQRRIGGYEWL